MTPLMANPDCTILVIDGSPDGADVYTHLLQQDAEVSYRVLIKHDYSSIVTLCQSESVDCVLLISHFLGNKLFEILDFLQTEMGDRYPPVILIGTEDTELAVQALKTGATDYLVKEKLTSEKLCQAIRLALKHPIHLIQTSPEPPSDPGFSSPLIQADWRNWLQSILDQVQVGMIILTAVRNQSDEIIDFESQIITPPAKQILQPSNLASRRLSDIFPTSITSELLTASIQVIETGKQWKSVQSYFKNGYKNYIQIVANKLNEILLIQVWDMTEQKIEEQILNGSAIAISLFHAQRDEQGKIIDLIYQGGNKTAESLFKQSNPAMRGKTLLQLWPGVKTLFFDQYVNVVETGEPMRMETYYPYDGFDSWFEISAVKNNEGLIITFQDITTQKKADQAVIQIKDQLAEQATDKYRTLFNSMDEGYLLAEVIFDENNQPIDVLYLEANPAAMRILGQDFTGRRLREIDPNYEAYWYEIPGRVAQTGKGERGEKYAKPDQKWYEFYMFKVGERHESKVAVLFNDVSDIYDELRLRKQAEEQLQQSEQRYRAIVNQAVTGVCYTGLDGLITIVNQKYCEITGYSAAELSQKRMQEITHPDDLPHNIELYHRMLREGTPFEIEKRYIRKDGSIVWVNNHVSLIRDQEGNPQSLVAICIDITERQAALRDRQQAEEALRESEENFRVIFNASSVGKAQIDAINRCFLRVNPALCAITGYSESELLTMTVDDLNHPEDCGRDRQLYQHLKAGTTDDYQSEKRYVCKDGSIRWVNEIGNAIRDPQGKLMRTVAVIEDVTERKRLEANAAFLAEITEDFSRLSTPDEIMQVIGAKIGRYLKITTCNFCDVDEAGGWLTIRYSWKEANVPSLIRTYRTADYLSEEFGRANRAGEMIVICDTQTDPRTYAQTYVELQIRAFVTVPFQQNGEWKSFLSVTDSQPRDWRSDELELIQELSNRIFPRLERARAEAALRKSEEKYRSLFNSIDEGFCIIQMIFNSDHKPIDYRFIEINRIFEQQTGLKNALGRTVRELVPNIEPSWVDIYGEVALTGQPTRFINHAQSMGRWFDVNAFRIGEPDERKVAILFNDITARKKSEQERERFLAVGSDFQVITGMNGYFHWVSPSFERLLGWTQAEMTSHPWTDFVHPDDINPSISETDSLFSGNKTFAFENRYRHKDGSYLWLLWNAQPYPDEQVIYGAAVDITARKLAEVALRESEEQFRTMADHAPFMVWVTDPNGDGIYLSESWYEFTGQTRESSLGLGWLNQTHPDDRKNAKSTFLKANEQQVAFRLEYRLQRKDGEYIWVIDAANPWFGAEGQFKGFIGSVIDISDRKQAEAAVAADLRDTQLLRDLSARLTTEADPQVLYDEILTTAITLMQADSGSFQFLNHETQELLLLSTKGFNRSLAGCFDRITTTFNTSCGIALATGERSFIDFDVPASQDPDGHRRIHLNAGLMSAQSTPLISRKGKLIGMVSTHWCQHHRPSERELRFLDLLARQAADLIEQRQDEAEREQLLEQEQAARAEAERMNRIKDEFLSILSHELRSPLNPILGWSRLLQTQKMDDAKIANALATIERNARLQTQLIDDLLDVARILRGKFTLNQAPVDFLSVIEAAIEVVRTAAEAKSISLLTQLTDIGQVRGDHGRLQQIIWNLLSNAIKFTPTGGQVSIRLEPVDCYAQVTITDTGRGISPRFLPYIFESFRQEDTSITRQHGGLGLGLSIVKYLVDAHGGTITADSPGEGQGATFTVKLPLLQDESISPLIDPLPSLEINLAGVKVLAVDDSEDTRALLETLLTEYGAAVRVVASGKEAFVDLKSFEPDVLVCDIGMPDLDGYHLLQQIRALPAEQGGNVPAIAVTAFATQEDYQRALNYGFQKHIAKPIEPEILVITIAELVLEN